MFSPGNEIVTFALGHYSSHVVTHFYNIQESCFSYNPNFQTGINHDALFRESSHRSKSTYTPRLVILDDPEALGFLSKEGCYKTSGNSSAEDDGEAQVIVTENKWERNEFISDVLKEKQSSEKDPNSSSTFLMKNSYNLDECTFSWSDYSITEFNNKTVVTLPKNTDYYDSYDKFTDFHSGISLWNKTSLHEDIEENTRFFMEEADNFQGFQVLFDGDNGYSGISSGCLELLHDEYHKKAILAVPVLYSDLSPSDDVVAQHRKRSKKIYSLTSGLSVSSQYCNLITPMSHIFDPWGKNPRTRVLNNIQYRPDLMYHTSALLAATLDLFTLPCRLQIKSSSLHSIASSINVYGRSITAAGIRLPLPTERGGNEFSSIEKITGNFFDSLTPCIEITPENIDVQSVATKGLGKNQVNYNPDAVNDFLKLYLYNNFPRVISSVGSCKSRFRVPRTFPKVIDESFNLSMVDNCYGPLAEFIAFGGMHNSKDMGNVLNSLYENARSIKINRIPGFGATDSDIDYKELFEDMKNLSLKYSDITYV
ncbi:protein misato [Halyomorpha halys]|uniref:protein misato n=1 Tax=Halyomorpha halys TaxID=286706 RepID=UPI0006D527BC|nr:protein misato [Halyomorpha halys]